MTAPFVQPAPQRRSLGTSGVFHVSDLSPSINPDILGPIGLRDKTRNLAAIALKALREQGLAAAHACRQIHGDQSLGEAERHRRANKASADLLLAAQLPMEKAVGAISKELAGLHEKLAGPIVELSDVRAIEIRSKISGLPAAKRFAAVAKSIEKGGDEIAAAVLNADRLMSDFLTDIEEAEVRKMWQRSKFPAEVARVAELESALVHLERGAHVMQSWQRSTHNPAIADTVIRAGATTYGAQGPVPVDRSRGLDVAARARAFTYS